jgi:hypothetical protein
MGGLIYPRFRSLKVVTHIQCWCYPPRVRLYGLVLLSLQVKDVRQLLLQTRISVLIMILRCAGCLEWVEITVEYCAERVRFYLAKS